MTGSIISGYGWLSGVQFFTTGIRFLGTIYLARNIDPYFFGQQGLALSVISIFWSFIMIGDQHSLIKQQKDIYEYMRTMLSIKVLITFILSVILLILWFSGFLPGSSEIQLYIVLLFFSQVPAQIGSVYIASMTKQMLFARLALLNIISSSAGVLTACILAFYGYKIWALLWLFMAEQFVSAILSVLLIPKVFSPVFNKAMAIQFFHYSKYFSITSILDRIQGKAGDISVGSFIGEASLGFYQRAYGLSGLLQTVIMGGLSTVLQPYFAEMQGDRDRFGGKFEIIGCLLTRVSCVTFVCLAFVLPELIVWIYGEKWLPTVPVFRLILPFAILQSFRLILRNTHKVAGSVKLLAKSQTIELLILLLFLFPLIYWKGVLGAAIALNISIIVGVGLMLHCLREFANFSVRRIFANPLIASFIAALVTLWYKSAVGAKFGAAANVGIEALIVFISFMATLLLFEYSFLKRTLQSVINLYR